MVIFFYYTSFERLTLIFSKQINIFENYLCAAVDIKRNVLYFLLFIL